MKRIFLIAKFILFASVAAFHTTASVSNIKTITGGAIFKAYYFCIFLGSYQHKIH